MRNATLYDFERFCFVWVLKNNNCSVYTAMSLFKNLLVFYISYLSHQHQQSQEQKQQKYTEWFAESKNRFLVYKSTAFSCYIISELTQSKRSWCIVFLQ